MVTARVLGLIAVLLAVGSGHAAPQKSEDVVEVKLERYTLADGLESYFVTLKVAKGWHVYANPAGAKALTDSATTIEFFLDGRRTKEHNIHYPKGILRKGANGEEYRAYEQDTSFTAWLVWDETKDAAVVAVRVKVVATDGKSRLKESVVSATAR